MTAQPNATTPQQSPPQEATTPHVSPATGDATKETTTPASSAPQPPHDTGADVLVGVSRTLLIPLLARADAQTRFARMGFVDPIAHEVSEDLNLTPEKVSRDAFPMRLCVARSIVLDQAVGALLQADSNRLCVVLACGLDTLPQRLGLDAARWVCADLAPVMALRKRLLPQEAQLQHHEVELPDSFDSLRPLLAETKPLLILEGLLPYFSPQDATRCLQALVQACPHGADLFVDSYHPALLAFSRLGATFRRMEVQFRYGVRHPRALTDASTRLQLHQSWNLLDLIPWQARKRCIFPRLLAGTNPLANMNHLHILPTP